MKNRWLRLFVALFMLCHMQDMTAQGKHIYPHIPANAIYYNSKWEGVTDKNKASYYRLLAVDDKGRQMFYDYYISGQLKSEKHYSSVDSHDDKKTVLDGMTRTFYKTGRVESIMTYKNGKANGRAVSFFQDGNVGMKFMYKDGRLDGTSCVYEQSGKLLYTVIWKDGSKVSEKKGGRDPYIDWSTNSDPFCDRYRQDEVSVMAQSSAIERVEATLPIGTDAIVKSSQNLRSTSKAVASVVKSNVQPTNINYSIESLLNMLIIDRVHTLEEYRHVAMGYGATRLDSITIAGNLKELCFLRDMQYVKGIDTVTGAHPRQIGFRCMKLGSDSYAVQSISLYTDSFEEWQKIKSALEQRGLSVLDPIYNNESTGSFVMKSKNATTGLAATFYHVPHAYAGLYHVSIEVK
jgi:hypothetical protein